jgi:hypothetical protein
MFSPSIGIASVFILLILERIFHDFLAILHPIDNTVYYAVFHSGLWGMLEAIWTILVILASTAISATYGTLDLVRRILDSFGGQEVRAAQGLSVPVVEVVASVEEREASQSPPPSYVSLLPNLSSWC